MVKEKKKKGKWALNECTRKHLRAVHAIVSHKRVTSTRFSALLQYLLILKSDLNYMYSATATDLVTISTPSTRSLVFNTISHRRKPLGKGLFLGEGLVLPRASFPSREQSGYPGQQDRRTQKPAGSPHGQSWHTWGIIKDANCKGSKHIKSMSF